MNKAGHLTLAGLSFSAAFGLVAFSAFHLGRDNGFDEGYLQGESKMRAAFYQKRVDCQDARAEAGVVLGQYILGENDVSARDVDAAEQAASNACRSFEF